MQHAHPDLSDEFHLINLEMRAGKPRAEALRNLVERTGVDDVRALVATLVQTDRFGTSVSQALRIHSDSLRTERRQRAEEQAAKTTIKMIIPLVLFVLPSIIFVTLGPAIIQLFRILAPGQDTENAFAARSSPGVVMPVPGPTGYALNRTRQSYLARVSCALRSTHWSRFCGLMGTDAGSFPAGQGLWIVPSRGVHTFAMRFRH